MRKYLALVILSLMTCLFVYVFYRTEKTLISHLILAFVSRDTFVSVKQAVCTAIPLKEYFIFSLPEGLWIFCITITSSFFFVEWRGRQFNLNFLPVLIAIFMELLQLVRISNGRFDPMDLIFSVGFWMLAICLTRNTTVNRQALFTNFDRKTICCTASYVIVFLAHVIY